MEKFASIFGDLEDPRAPNCSHELLEVLFIALAATLCGAEGASDMAQFGSAKEGLFRQFLRLKHGVPSHDTFSRVFRELDPAAFEREFHRFVVAFADTNGLKLTGVIAVDGKALAGAYERGCSATPLQLVNVFAAEARVALASRKAPGRNEAGGALEVLAMLSLKDCIVTADALHCHSRFAEAVLRRGAHYVLALKKNQSKIFDAVERRFARSGTRSSAEQRDPVAHDRFEARRATVIRDKEFEALLGFPGVVAIGRITSRRRLSGKPADPPSVRYYLLSKYLPASKLLHVVRSHWAIENQLHWLLDVVFDEDASRARKDNAPENLATLRRLAINILRTHPERISMRLKAKRAGWDDAFLLNLLSHMR